MYTETPKPSATARCVPGGIRRGDASGGPPPRSGDNPEMAGAAPAIPSVATGGANTPAAPTVPGSAPILFRPAERWTQRQKVAWSACRPRAQSRAAASRNGSDDCLLHDLCRLTPTSANVATRLKDRAFDIFQSLTGLAVSREYSELEKNKE